MPNNKEMQKSGSGDAMENSSTEKMSGRAFETQSQNKDSDRAGKDGEAGSSREYGKDNELEGTMDDGDITTAGGREGQFSDKNRGSEDQWSPGSSGGSSDE